MFPATYRFTFAIFYLICVSILFFLPGSALPQDNWMTRIWLFDKWVHLGFFIVLLWLWCWAFYITEKKGLMLLFIAAAMYGLLVEIIQHLFISNRSFDITDWIADMVGSNIGLWFWRKVYKKIRPL
ncbi:MAG: VanZ family protein [Flavisolibacter sp.]|nr:VanZ family protein [Flavisolibacter sp.]MBD0351407.1 VanZ family protein [Flavisolibacter sp.]